MRANVPFNFAYYGRTRHAVADNRNFNFIILISAGCVNGGIADAKVIYFLTLIINKVHIDAGYNRS